MSNSNEEPTAGDLRDILAATLAQMEDMPISRPLLQSVLHGIDEDALSQHDLATIIGQFAVSIVSLERRLNELESSR